MKGAVVNKRKTNKINKLQPPKLSKFDELPVTKD